MRGLTKKERRAIERELKPLEKERLRLIVDSAPREGFWVVRITAMDDKNSMTLAMPLKDEPDIEKVRKQLGRKATSVSEAM